MDTLLKIMTPENFAMLITIFLLVRFEKAISLLTRGLGDMERGITGSIDRNSRLLAILLFTHRKENNRCRKGFEELVGSPEKADSDESCTDPSIEKSEKV